jgi:hypothetical protein
MNGELMPRIYLLQQIEVAENQGGLGYDSKPQAAFVSERFKQGACDGLFPLEGLVGVGGGT